MRRIVRTALPARTVNALAKKQDTANTKHAAATLNATNEWKAARQTKPVKSALEALKAMSGPRERCMYCNDSHGTDIDHFWPKTPYPTRMFAWSNFVLGCTECGRFKGERFPLDGGVPQLVDPTAEDPWAVLDFDPDTGNLTARFDPTLNDWAPRGAATVNLLQLDRREALAAGYRKTHIRISAIIEQHLAEPTPDPVALSQALREADEHGLLGWCFTGTGINQPPFNEFQRRHAAAWAECARLLF